MNVLLIKPYWPYPYSKGEFTYNRIWPPLCLANCAAILEKDGHRVEILDASAQGIKPHMIVGFIRGFDKIFITSSTLDKWQCPNIDITPFLETARRIREYTDELYCMGYHGTVDPERILKETRAKAVIRGEYEYPVVEICKNIELFNIKGITFNSDGKIISTPERELSDLSGLPVPAFHLLDFKKYSYEILGRNFALFELGRGCKFNCIFCNKTMYGPSVRFKTIAQILREIAEAIENNKVRTGYFIDLDFLANKEIAQELCDFLIKRKYKFNWTCQTRPDLLDSHILKKMKQAGCQIIHMGIESGAQKSLDYVRKNISIDKIRKAVKMCKEAKIKILAFMLFGLPDETKESRQENLEFIKSLNPEFVSLRGLVEYSGQDNASSNSKDSKDLNKFLSRAVLGYYLNPSYFFKLRPTLVWGCLKLLSGRVRTLK